MKETIKFDLEIIDGSTVVWDSGMTDLGTALRTVKSAGFFEIGKVIYFKTAVMTAKLSEN